VRRASQSSSLFQRKLSEAAKKVEELQRDSEVRLAWEEVREQVKNAIQEGKYLSYDYLPPLFVFIVRHSVDELAALDTAVKLVRDNTPERKRKSITSFLRSKVMNGADAGRQWAGKLFELHIKSLALTNKLGIGVELDPTLPNGREQDLRISLGSRDLMIECTVINTTDEYEEAWRRYREDLKVDSNAVHTPNRHLKSDGNEPKPEYQQVRFYQTVYGKLARDFNPAQSQCSLDKPNVLFVSSFDDKNPWARDGYSWALDELFLDQPVLACRIGNSMIDTSLVGWIDFTAEELRNNGKLTFDRYQENYQQLLTAPRLLGGIFLFEQCSPIGLRLNYNANSDNKLTHREAATLEQLFGGMPGWEKSVSNNLECTS
jgi:hypothetical protein